MDGATSFADGRGRLFADMVMLIQEVTSGWETDFQGGITADTHLVHDLNCESIDLVMLIVAIKNHFQRDNLPFEDLLLRDGQYVDDLSVAEIVDFLWAQLTLDTTDASGRGTARLLAREGS